MKTIKLDDALNAQNSRVTGISIDSKGCIREVRTRIRVAPEENATVFSVAVNINPIINEKSNRQLAPQAS